MELNMILSKGRNEVVAVVIAILQPDLHALTEAFLLSSLLKVLWQKLSLLVEVISGARVDEDIGLIPSLFK